MVHDDHLFAENIVNNFDIGSDFGCKPVLVFSGFLKLRFVLHPKKNGKDSGIVV